MKEHIQTLVKDSLFLNSFYLMLATGVVAFFGFIFWIINAHLFHTDEIGLATTLISITNLIAMLSLIGFSSVFVRFLPKSKQKNEKLSTGFILVSIISVLFSVGFVFFVPHIAPKVAFIQDHFLYAGIFVLACLMGSIGLLCDSVYLSKKNTKLTLLIGTLAGFTRIILPFLFVGYGAMGIFFAVAASQTLAACIGIVLIQARLGFTFIFAISTDVLKQIWHYTAVSYAASILNLLPVTILPILILNDLGPEEAAYYYIVMMIGNLLYVIPWSSSKSLLAESANDERTVAKNIRHSATVTLSLVIPAMVVLFVAGEFILSIFGPEYAEGGLVFLYLVAITGFAIMGTSTYGALFQFNKDLRATMMMNIVYALIIPTLTFELLPLGLTGVGIAWLVGNATTALIAAILYRKSKQIDWQFYWLLIVIPAKIQYLYSRLRDPAHRQKIMLCYPETPHFFHILYAMAHKKGYILSDDPDQESSVIIHFEDTTVRKSNETLSKLSSIYHVVNFECKDIRKSTVDALFEKIFGYSLAVDPSTYDGNYVRKSDQNATHDGKIFEKHSQREPGYVYQKLIQNEDADETYFDIRVPIIKNSIPCVCIRYKDPLDRFNHTTYAKIAEVGDYLSETEVKHILAFSKELGLEYGELDVLRDKVDSRIYIVDANNTPASPHPGKQISFKDYRELLRRLSDAFEESFDSRPLSQRQRK